MSVVALRPACVLAVLAAVMTFLVVPNVRYADSARAEGEDACGRLVAKADGSLWQCSFVDDFNGSTLDLSKWVVGDTSYSGFQMNGTCFIPGQGYAVANGFLGLTVRRVPGFVCWSKYVSFVSRSIGGVISTYRKFGQAYGRFEARLRFPNFAGVGVHGGYWMNPQDRAYGPWPASGEIDVAEWMSNTADHLYPSLHYLGSTTKADTAWNCLLGDPTAFHTVDVDWSPTVMTFTYDGNVCFSRSWTPTNVKAPKPFDMPFDAVLIMAQGGGKNAPNAATPAVATLTVDYVKVWK